MPRPDMDLPHKGRRMRRPYESLNSRRAFPAAIFFRSPSLIAARSIHRVLKVSRTIADLAGEAEIRERHVGEALQYRGLERAWAQLKD